MCDKVCCSFYDAGEACDCSSTFRLIVLCVFVRSTCVGLIPLKIADKYWNVSVNLRSCSSSSLLSPLSTSNCLSLSICRSAWNSLPLCSPDNSTPPTAPSTVPPSPAFSSCMANVGDLFVVCNLSAVWIISVLDDDFVASRLSGRGGNRNVWSVVDDLAPLKKCGWVLSSYFGSTVVTLSLFWSVSCAAGSSCHCLSALIDLPASVLISNSLSSSVSDRQKFLSKQAYCSIVRIVGSSFGEGVISALLLVQSVKNVSSKFNLNFESFGRFLFLVLSVRRPCNVRFPSFTCWRVFMRYTSVLSVGMWGDWFSTTLSGLHLLGMSFLTSPTLMSELLGITSMVEAYSRLTVLRY